MRNLFLLLTRFKVTLVWLALSVLSLVISVQYNQKNNETFHNYASLTSSYIEAIRSKLMKRYYTRQENEALRAENLRLRQEIMYKNYLIRKLSFPKLPDTLHFNSDWTFIPARVVNQTIHKQYNFITLNAGSQDGVAKGDGVICAQGVVGIVIAVNKNYCVAASVLNKNTKIRVKTSVEGSVGILEWKGDKITTAKLNYIPAHVLIQPDDVVVTSSYANIFPDGILVGRLVQVQKAGINFFDITVNLSTNFSQLSDVYITHHKTRGDLEMLEKSILPHE
ncbi:MAG: rod shape-determining protein MreC [Bacteroidia bacterium]|nr:rod shape-determining protein MreC [Bacteroidia bacterium]MDW8345798.1 rod shape-determining protein MreC [Bacteroidia bacterium]